MTAAFALAEPCAWCQRRIAWQLNDPPLTATTRSAARIEILDRIHVAHAAHQATELCATAGHDPGDEDAGEAHARLAWRLAP